MSQITVPKSVVEGRSGPFPIGTYIGILGDVKERWFKDNETGKETTLFLDLSFGNNAPLNGNGTQVGARTFRPSIVLVTSNKEKTKKFALVDITEFSDDTPFALQNAASMASQLALAFGTAHIDTEGNVNFDLGAFIENLAAGAYKGRSIVFEITHRPWKSKATGKSGVEARPRFMSAEPGNAAPEDAEFEGESAALRLRTRA